MKYLVEIKTYNGTYGVQESRETVESNYVKVDNSVLIFYNYSNGFEQIIKVYNRDRWSSFEVKE
jgi:hypothetical protein